MGYLSLAIVDCYTGAFLSAMLEGSESQGEVVPYVNFLVLLLYIDAYDTASIV
jgi:hypothetical protein